MNHILRLAALTLILATIAPPPEAGAQPAPPTLADVWAGRATIAPTFEVVRGMGPGHQRVSFVPAPDGSMAAYGRARCNDKHISGAPWCIYRATSADGLTFDDTGRAPILGVPSNALDPSVARLPSGWYVMAYELNGRWIGLAASDDGRRWRDLGRVVASCAGDPGLCDALGGKPGRGTTTYGRYSVSTPGLALRCAAGSATCDAFLTFAVRTTRSAANDKAQLALGLLTFSLPAQGEPRPSALRLLPDLVLQGGSWDRLTVSAPMITTNPDGTFTMLYEGSPAGYGDIGQPWGIGMARSADGIHWEKYGGDGLLMAATTPRTPGDRANLERGARSYPGFYTFGGNSYITMAYRGPDDESRSDYTVRYRLLWKQTPAPQRLTLSARLALPLVAK